MGLSVFASWSASCAVSMGKREQKASVSVIPFVPPYALPSDSVLLANASGGNGYAFAELWSRHSDAAARAARQFSPLADPSTVLYGTYRRIRSLAGVGRVPSGAFRPYLLDTIAHVAGRPAAAAVPRLAASKVALDRSLTVRAYSALPEQWQSVLWYTSVEGMPRAAASARLMSGGVDRSRILETSILLGLSVGATLTLTRHARMGLRRSWLDLYVLDESNSPSCRWLMEALLRDQSRHLTEPEIARARRHLSACDHCIIAVEELGVVHSRLGSVLLPRVLGPAWLGYLEAGR